MAFEEINPGIWTPEKEGDSLEGILSKLNMILGHKTQNYTTSK